MRIKSMIDDKKKQHVRDAIARGDSSIFGTKKGSTPLVEPASGIDWSKFDLKGVETLATAIQGAPVWEAVERANREAKIIVPNLVHDRLLDLWDKPEIKPCYPVWTGTLVAYRAPDTPFGERIILGWPVEVSLSTQQKVKADYSLSFSIPKKFQDKENCALIVEHPDFDIADVGLGIRFEVKVRNENAVHLLENFPRTSGWYHFDQRFRIPVGEKLEVAQSNNAMRYLERTTSGYVGLLARGYSDGGVRRRIVDASDRPNEGLGIAVIDREVIAKMGGKP